METLMVFLYVLGGIVGLSLSILAIRVAFKFDINKWQERKDERNVIRLRNTCPHMSVEYDPNSGQIRVDSFFVTPHNTTNWICGQCGMVVLSHLMIPKYPTDLNGAKEVVKAQKKFIKLAKKAGLI